MELLLINAWRDLSPWDGFGNVAPRAGLPAWPGVQWRVEKLGLTLLYHSSGLQQSFSTIIHPQIQSSANDSSPPAAALRMFSGWQQTGGIVVKFPAVLSTNLILYAEH